MNVETYLRMTAGFFVFLSVVLGHFVHPAFLIFTAFVGLNLLQSAFTGWCPMVGLLHKLGVPDCGNRTTGKPA